MSEEDFNIVKELYEGYVLKIKSNTYSIQWVSNYNNVNDVFDLSNVINNIFSDNKKEKTILLQAENPDAFNGNQDKDNPDGIERR